MHVLPPSLTLCRLLLLPPVGLCCSASALRLPARRVGPHQLHKAAAASQAPAEAATEAAEQLPAALQQEAATPVAGKAADPTTNIGLMMEACCHQVGVPSTTLKAQGGLKRPYSTAGMWRQYSLMSWRRQHLQLVLLVVPLQLLLMVVVLVLEAAY